VGADKEGSMSRSSDVERVEVHLPRDLLRELDEYVGEDRARSRSVVIGESLRELLKPHKVVMLSDGTADWRDEFDRLLEHIPTEWRQAAVDVRDTLHIANAACRAEFGRPVSPEVVLQAALAMLSRADAYARPTDLDAS
jgi:Arc/MetJ-type ribon-helix-helix transcriptional regulator